MKIETLEEVAENYVDSFEYGIAHPRRVCKNAFINGAKWQQERMYSEEEVKKILHDWSIYKVNCIVNEFIDILTWEEWLEQVKKK